MLPPLRNSFIYTAALLCVVVAREPTCSAFHYEEKLLEKMIRMEIKMEELYSEMRTKEDTTRRTSDATAAKVLEAMRENEERLDALQGNMNKLEKKLNDGSGIAVTTPLVAFNVHSPKDLSLSTGETIMFSREVLNTGGSYDTKTGQFTAPVTGLYWFSVFLCVEKHSVEFDIKQDTLVLMTGTVYENDGYTCSGGSVAAMVKAGQKVWIESLGGGDKLVNNDYTKNAFTGVLIGRQ